MKPHVILLIVVLFASCSSDDQRTNNVADANKIARNKETAVKNEVTAVTRAAQKLEQKGRGMEIYRMVKNPESARECKTAFEDGQKQIQDLETRIKNLPESYNARLMPVIGDLTECVSCSNEAKAGCVKARASVNKAIAEIYGQ